MDGSISVIVTVWKRTNYLAEALRSALAQTHPADEIIVTDDSNSPAIRAICGGFAHGRVRWRANERQLGAAGNLAAALAEAQGEWVAILNDDDAWEPDFLARLSGPLREDRRRVLAFGDHWIMDQSGRTLAEETEANSARYHRNRLASGPVERLAPLVFEHMAVPVAVAALWRRDAVSPGDLLSEVGAGYDVWIGALLAATGRPAFYVPARVARYRVHGAMETNRFSPARWMPAAFIYAELLRRGWFPEYTALFRRRHRDACLRCGADQLSAGANAEAGKWLREARNAGAGFPAAFLTALAALPPPWPGIVVNSLRRLRSVFHRR